MRATMLTAVSALALMATMPAVAETQVNAKTQTSVKAEAGNNIATPDVETVDKQDIKREWENTKDAVSDATEAAGDAIQKTYYDLKNAFTDAPETGDTVVIQTRTTAQGMIGKDVYDANGKSVASIEDILLDKNGKASRMILRDGGFFGMGGKLVALDYDRMTKGSDDGDVLVGAVSQDMLDKVAEFDYDKNKAASNYISVKNLMDANVLSSKGDTVAEVDNVAFENGKASMLVLSFNDVLNMGGDNAVVAYDELPIVRTDDGKVNFTLSAKQSAEFENFKREIANKS